MALCQTSSFSKLNIIFPPRGSQLSTKNSQLFVAPLRELHGLEGERLAVQLWRLDCSVALKFPGEHRREVFVVAQCLTVGRLMFFAEMAAARFIAGEGVGHHQLSELEEIVDA